MIDLGTFEIAEETLVLVPEALCARHRAIPVSKQSTSLVVAMVDPTNTAAIEALRDATGLKIEPVVTTERALAAAIARYYGGRG